MGDGVSWRRCVMLIICSHGHLLICIELFSKNQKNTNYLTLNPWRNCSFPGKISRSSWLMLCMAQKKSIQIWPPYSGQYVATECEQNLILVTKCTVCFTCSIPVFVSFSIIFYYYYYLGVYTRSWYLTISVSLHPWQRSCSILVTKFAHCKRCEIMVVLKDTTNLNWAEEVATFNLHQLSGIY